MSHEVERPPKILNLAITKVDPQSVRARADAIAVVLHGPSPDNPPLRAVLSLSVAEALTDALRAGLAAAQRLRAGRVASALPRLALFQVKVHSEQPIALLHVALDDGREFDVNASPRDLTALRRALDEALSTLPQPERLSVRH